MGLGRSSSDSNSRDRQEGASRTILSKEDWRRIADALQLPPRELQVVQHLFDGDTEARAAWLLGIKHSTVRTLMKRIYARTGTSSHAELLVRVFEEHVAGLSSETRDSRA